MVLASAVLVPELQHYFYEFVVSSAVNKFRVPAPVDIDTVYIPQRSFIELLFNENYSYNSYEYRYTENDSWGTIPTIALNRISLYPGAGKYMELDADGANSFLLQQHDFEMLDALLEYRQDSTAVTIIDSTNVVSFDSTSMVLTVDYDYLNTNLSKLIFLYLDLKIRGNISRYNNSTLIAADDELLETCYETLVLDEFFKLISSRGT